MKLKWAFNSATVLKLPWEEEFALLAEYGLRAVEPWYDKLKAVVDRGSSFQAIGHQLTDVGVESIGLSPGVLMIPGQEGQGLDQERDEMLRRMDATAELGAPALTIIVLGKPGPDLTAVYQGVADKLRAYADHAQQRGIRLNLEFLGGLPFNGCLGACIDLVKRVDHPDLGLLLDLCHYYCSFSHLEDLVLLPEDKLFHVHVDDAPNVPMESLRNDMRCFPGQGGRMDVPKLLRKIRKMTGYQGYYAIELYDPPTWERDPRAVFADHLKAVKYVEKRMKK